MLGETSQHRFFAQMEREQRELMGVLGELRAAVVRTDTDEGVVDRLAGRLAELVTHHFAMEERGGYLKEALDRAPRLIEKAEALRRDHGRLAERVDAVRKLASRVARDADAAAAFPTELQTFVIGLLDHEANENDLLQTAFSDDIGTND